MSTAQERTTDELNHILQSCGPEDFPGYLNEHAQQLQPGKRSFTEYMRRTIRSKGLQQQDVFLNADIPERYGYKLISGERHTRQRDVIVRLCLASHFTLREAQTALALYEMPALYARIPRDAALIIAFNTEIYNPYDVDRLLSDNGLEPLYPCGEADISP